MLVLEGLEAVAEVERLSKRASRLDRVEPEVSKIVSEVRQTGDAALRRYAQQWDGLAEGQAIRIEKPEIDAAWRSLSQPTRDAMKQAAGNIRQFAEWQKPKEWIRGKKGVIVGQIVRSIESVGCYVPGGRYPLPSTLLMTVIPAQVAGVERICVVSPKPRRETLAAAAMLGITEFYRIGGAQAVAALAYGTQSIPSVAKIVGPGNLYVTAAKKLVAFDCGIDFLAGPTEAVVLLHLGRADFIASDLVAQAEHDPEAVSIFITSSRRLAKSVQQEVENRMQGNSIAEQALEKNGRILIARFKAEAMAWSNKIAPEHLTVSAEDLPKVRNAGSVFASDYSAQAAGDYVAGPNHVLPTGGMAKLQGGLTVLDFVKVITVQRLTSQGIRAVGPAAVQLAEAEGLLAHAESVRLRMSHA